jgi:hypothetical protein
MERKAMIKKSILLAIAIFSTFCSMSQESSYFRIFSQCEDSRPGCFDIGIDWKNQEDPSEIPGSDVIFTYFPDGKCGKAEYRLSPKEGQWSYSDSSIRIFVKMYQVETFIGYSPSHVSIESADPCVPSMKIKLR